MESVKNIRNDELVKAYEALHTDNSKAVSYTHLDVYKRQPNAEPAQA